MNNHQNTQLSFLHGLLIYSIGFLTLLGAVQCKCNQPSETSKKLEITVSKTCLRAPETEFEVIVKPAEGHALSSLKDFKLKAQFLEQEIFEDNLTDKQDNCLAHKHAADKQIFSTCLMIPLNEYTREVESASDSAQEQSELRIPILLRPSKQATKLKIGIELLDIPDKVLENVEVMWIKNELLISELTTLKTAEKESIMSLTLKNTKDIPIKTNNLLINLTSGQLNPVLFSRTNTSQAILDQLLDDCITLEPGAKTSPIFLKLNKGGESQDFPNLTITVNQEGNKILATRTILWPQIKPSLDHCKHQEEQAQEQKQEEQQKFEAPTTLPHLQIKIVHTTNKKFTLFIENTGQKISKQLLQLVKLKYSIQGIGNIENVKFKRGSLADINNVSLAELLKSGLQEGQTKELEIILEPGNANSLSIDFSLEGTQDNSLLTFNWEKKQKPIKKEEKVEKNEIKFQETDDVLQQNLEKLKVEAPLALPNLYINTKASDKTSKIFKLMITNQGETISEDALKNVKLHYTLEGTGDIKSAYLKRRGNATDINERSLLEFIKSGFNKDQTKEFELIIETGNAKTLTIHLALEGTQNGNPAIFNWITKNELKKKTVIKDKKSIQKTTSSPQPAAEQALVKEKEETQEATNQLELQPNSTEAFQGDRQEIQKVVSNLQTSAAQALGKKEEQIQATASNVQANLAETKQQESIQEEKSQPKNYKALNSKLIAKLQEDLKSAAADYEATRELLKQQDKNHEKEKNWWQKFLDYKK